MNSKFWDVDRISWITRKRGFFSHKNKAFPGEWKQNYNIMNSNFLEVLHGDIMNNLKMGWFLYTMNHSQEMDQKFAQNCSISLQYGDISQYFSNQFFGHVTLECPSMEKVDSSHMMSSTLGIVGNLLEIALSRSLFEILTITRKLRLK